MLILAIRSDQAEAELLLFNDYQKIDEIKWLAHRILADTLHLKIKELLTRNNLNWPAINGIICFIGPGSFTGLRIGISVANALAYSLSIPIIGGKNHNWQTASIAKLLTGQNQKILIPEYGHQAHITLPQK